VERRVQSEKFERCLFSKFQVAVTESEDAPGNTCKVEAVNGREHKNLPLAVTARASSRTSNQAASALYVNTKKALPVRR
jgi:hypothetical protein